MKQISMVLSFVSIYFLPVESMKVRETGLELGKESSRLEEKKFYADEYFSEQDYQRLIKNYIQRYISLFLITSNLRDYEVKDLSETISVELEISVTGEDLIYLQQQSRGEAKTVCHGDLSKLDEILSKIARLKERSFMENSMRTWKFYLFSFVSNVLSTPEYHPFLVVSIIFLATLLINFVYLKKSFCICIISIVNSMILWDGFICYKKKLKDIALELDVKLLQLQGVPDACFPEKMSWYHKISGLFKENECLQYFKSRSMEPLEEVSLLQCIIDSYALYYIRIPIKIFGTSIKDYIGEISDLWPWPLNKVAAFPMVILLTLFVLFFVALFSSGSRIRLSFLGAAIEVEERKRRETPDKKSLREQPGGTVSSLQGMPAGEASPVGAAEPERKITLPKRLDPVNLSLSHRRRKLSL